MKIVLIQIISLFVFTQFFYIYALSKKRNDIADVLWGLGFILIALIGLSFNPNPKTALVFALVFIWGARLSFHIFRKFVKKSDEDRRYKQWRDEWGKLWPLFSWLKVFLLQNFFLVLVAAPIIILSISEYQGFNLINIFGVMVWFFGFFFEVLGDRQLKDFLKKRQGKEIMREGLWKYSRHPNYFGEAVLWWGIALLAYGETYFYLALLGPIVINILLRFVSGVPMAEKGYKDNTEYIEYKKKTPAMLPNFFIK